MQITINLPDRETTTFLNDLLANGTYSSVDEYVAMLIMEDRQRRHRAGLEKLLLEGLQGEPRELTAKDWDEMRRRFDERHPESAAS